MDTPTLAMFKASPDGALGSLIWWDVSLLMAGAGTGWALRILLPTQIILWFYIFVGNFPVWCAVPDFVWVLRVPFFGALFFGTLQFNPMGNLTLNLLQTWEQTWPENIFSWVSTLSLRLESDKFSQENHFLCNKNKCNSLWGKHTASILTLFQLQS